MDQEFKNPQTKKDSIQRRILFNAYLTIAGLTIGLALIVIVLGFLLDRFFGTQPVITFGLLALSAPLVIWLNSIVIRRAITNLSKEKKD